MDLLPTLKKLAVLLFLWLPYGLLGSTTSIRDVAKLAELLLRPLLLTPAAQSPNVLPVVTFDFLSL